MSPGVIQTVGALRWPELSDTFSALVRDTKFRVRRTLSHSLHEVARIIGPDRAATHLLPVCRTFLKDIDDVKVRHS